MLHICYCYANNHIDVKSQIKASISLFNSCIRLFKICKQQFACIFEIHLKKKQKLRLLHKPSVN